MAYARLRRRRIPIGSGHTERTIRCVINLHLKGNAKFGRQENAEGVLLLRGYLLERSQRRRPQGRLERG